MPYYNELFVNRTIPQTFVSKTNAGAVTQSHSNIAVMDSVEMMSYRSRGHPKAVATSIVEDINADPYAGFLRRTSERQYREALESRGLKPSGDPDRGHAFKLTRHTIMSRPFDYTLTGFSQQEFTGALPVFNLPTNSPAYNGVFKGGSNLAPIPYQESNPLSSFAQSAYSRVAPTSEVFNSATFLGELREGLPNLVPDTMRALISESRRLSRHRNATLSRKGGNRFAEGTGSDYLNFQFGWLPLVSDIKNAATALARATVQLAQEGKRVHRKYSIPTESSFDYWDMTSSTRISIGGGGNYGVLSSDQARAVGGTGTAWTTGSPNGKGRVAKNRWVDRWFEGEFSSFYRLGFDPTDYFHRLDALVNTKITPEVLWELTPWSWLIDWNLRLGDSIRANQLASDDRLVMHYGYAMETASYRALHSVTPDRRSGALNYNGRSFDTSVQTTYKRRIRANPYGFRVTTPSAFTGGQLGILGALGLTKL